MTLLIIRLLYFIVERMKVESNWTKTRYSFICEDEKDKKFLDNMNKYIDELEEENKELKAKINKVIELFNEWDSSDLYDYIDDLDYYED